MERLLASFLTSQNASHYDVTQIQKSAGNIVYLLDVNNTQYVYKISKSKPVKALNEAQVLKFLENNLPNESFYPKLVLAEPPELIVTYMPGEKKYPFELTNKDLRLLCNIFDKLKLCCETQYFSKKHMCDVQTGSSYDLASNMLYDYALPKLITLENNRLDFASLLKSKILRGLELNKGLLEENHDFHFFHFDLINNLITAEDNVQLIDWETSGYGDIAYNLADLTTIGKLTNEKENILMDNFSGFKDSKFTKRYEYYKQLALFINFLWLYDKLYAEKIQPETIWTIDDLESKLLEEIDF